VKLAGSVALVIGTGGLSQALCRALVRKDCGVAVTDPDIGKAQAVASACGGLAIALEPSDAAMWHNALATACDLLGPLGLLLFPPQPAPSLIATQTSATSDKLISAPTNLPNYATAYLGIEAATGALAKSSNARTVHFLDARAWQPDQHHPTQSADLHAVRAWLIARRQTQRAHGHSGPVPSLIVGCGIPPKPQTTSPDEIAAATLWALERDKPEIFVPGGWGVKRFLRGRS
jgi:hypothetical protein